jgi:hypothetical protein
MHAVHKLGASFGLLALSVAVFPVASVACGSPPANGASDSTSEALIVTLPPVNTGCVFESTEWSFATDGRCGPPAPPSCTAYYAALGAQLQTYCLAPMEAAFASAPGKEPEGTYFAWCMPGTYPGAKLALTGGFVIGDCRPVSPAHASDNEYTQLVRWEQPSNGSLPGSCDMDACLKIKSGNGTGTTGQ